MDLLLRGSQRLVHVVVDRDLCLPGQLLPDEEARDDRGNDEAGRDEPRPQRPVAAFLVLLLFRDDRRRWGGSGCRRRDHRRGRGRGNSSCSRRAAEHLRRRVHRGGRDLRTPRDALEIALHLVGALVPLVRILGERAHHDHIELVRDVGPQRRGRLRRGGEVLHRDLDRRLAVERRLAGQQLVEDDAERVEVGARVDLASLGLLGREVLRRADDRARLGHLARAGARDPEVRHLHAALAVDEDVVRLDVAVHDAVPVCEAQRREDLARVLDRDVDRRGAAADDQLLQRAAVEELHRDVVGVLRLAAVVDRDDVRVVERGGVLGLAAEALDELVVVPVTAVEDLDRDAAAELLVLGEVDVGHPAGAELALDPVAPVEKGVDERVAYRHVRLKGRDMLSCAGVFRGWPWRSAPRPRRRSRSAASRRRQRRRSAGCRPARSRRTTRRRRCRDRAPRCPSCRRP